MATDYCIPDCEICGGAGFTALEDGSVLICKNSNATFAGTGVSYADLLVPSKLPKSKTLEGIANALDALINQGHGMIFVVGGYGIGKTVTAKARTAALAQAGIKGIYTRQSAMISHIREGYDEQNGQKEVGRRLKKYCETPWLVIDEVGRDRMTDFARETLAEIIDARYQDAISGNSMTVLISNDLPEEVLQPYLVDRIRDVKNKVLVYKSESLRGKNV